MASEGLQDIRLFPSSPDPRLYYPATTHERALAKLIHSLEMGEPFALIAGEAGMGKTLLAQVLLDRLENRSGVLFLPHGRFESCEGLLKTLLFDLGVQTSASTISDLRLELTGFLLEQASESGPGLVIQDECHLLGTEILEEYRILGNLETGLGRAVQTVFLGCPKVLEKIQDPVLVSLRQRLVVCPPLQKMDDFEAADYLLHHGRIRLGVGNYFSEEAMECIVRFSGGVPRLLNQAAQLAHEYRIALKCDQNKVGRESALRAIEDLKSPWGHLGFFQSNSGNGMNSEGLSQPDICVLAQNRLGLSA